MRRGTPAPPRSRCSARAGARRSTRARGSPGPGRRPCACRSASGSGSKPGTTGPNGSALPCSARNRSAVRMMSSELASHSSDVSPQAVMPWPPRTTPIACGLFRFTSAMSRPSWKPGRRQSTHATRSPKHSLVSASPSAAVASAMPESGCRWSMCGGVDEAVHRGVDRRRGAAPAVQAVVEGRDHLVLALDARVDVDERAQPVEPEHREAGLGERAQVTAGALHPQQLGRLGGHRVRHRALGGGVAAGVVGVARVRARARLRALDELGRGRLVGHVSSILPGRRPRGPPRSVPGIRWRRRPASGRRAGPGCSRQSARSRRTSV